MPERHGFLPEPTSEDIQSIQNSKNPVYTFFDQLNNLRNANGDPLVSSAIPCCYE